MNDERNPSTFDHLDREDRMSEPYHAKEWGGALSSEPLTTDREVTGEARTPSEMKTSSESGSRTSLKEKFHDVSGKAHQKLDDVRAKTRPAVRQKVDAIRTPVRNKIAEIRPVVDHRVRATKQSGRDAVVKGRSFLRDNPAILPAITTGIGLVVGMMARRALRRRKPLGVVIVESKQGAAAPVW